MSKKISGVSGLKVRNANDKQSVIYSLSTCVLRFFLHIADALHKHCDTGLRNVVFIFKPRRWFITGRSIPGKRLTGQRMFHATVPVSVYVITKRTSV